MGVAVKMQRGCAVCQPGGMFVQPESVSRGRNFFRSQKFLINPTDSHLGRKVLPGVELVQ